MASKNSKKILLAAIFWSVSAFLYVAASIPLISSSDELTKELGGISGVFLGVGLILFRTKFALSVFSDEDRAVSAKHVSRFRLLSLVVLLLTAAIAIGYLVRFCNGWAWNSSLNYIIVPFGLMFFYFGKWCFIKPGAGG